MVRRYGGILIQCCGISLSCCSIPLPWRNGRPMFTNANILISIICKNTELYFQNFVTLLLQRLNCQSSGVIRGRKRQDYPRA